MFSETVYTPALPEIAKSLLVRDALAEYTLTTYLFGFAVATLFWGSLSDKLGRKPCIVMGIALYVLGSLGCYFSDSITHLLLARLIQGFGGSVGSVVGQSICRDAFHGQALAKTYASLTSALAIFPAIGPLIGGGIDQIFGWKTIFLFLAATGSVIILFVVFLLPETHRPAQRKPVSFVKTFCRMIHDKRVIGFGLITALMTGIVFSYYAEGPFYLRGLLSLTPTQYGATFLAIAFANLCGGIVACKLHVQGSSPLVLTYGLCTVLTGGVLLLIFAFLGPSFTFLPTLKMELLAGGIVFSIMVIMAGFPIVVASALSLALLQYKECIGTASSLLGAFYFLGTSLVTLGMGFVHDGTLAPMPIYFFSLSVLMIIIAKCFLGPLKTHEI